MQEEYSEEKQNIIDGYENTLQAMRDKLAASEAARLKAVEALGFYATGQPCSLVAGNFGFDCFLIKDRGARAQAALAAQPKAKPTEVEEGKEQ